MPVYVAVLSQKLWNLTNKYYEQNMQQKFVLNWASSTFSACQKDGQDLTSYYQLQKLNIVYFWNLMSLLI